MELDLIDTRFMMLTTIADKIAEEMNVEDKTIKELVFAYKNTHYILNKYDGKWSIYYPQKDKYWFEYIEEESPINLDSVIDELKDR